MIQMRKRRSHYLLWDHDTKEEKKVTLSFAGSWRVHIQRRKRRSHYLLRDHGGFIEGGNVLSVDHLTQMLTTKLLSI